ncbi:MAG: SPFH domain-containing protein [Spirochaetes bacterium]|nr:SPFH domain-containing protein [Spirochaetota bacterium]
MNINLSTIDWPLVGTIIILVFATILIYLKVNLKICEPNEILIFSGKKRKLPTGEVVGYRVIRGGVGLRTPIVERVSRLSLATIPITLEIEGALSNGMIPLFIRAIAHVKIASREGAGLENAVERLLGKPQLEIETIAKNTIEGVLRGVIATFTPEDANYKRLEFERKVYELAHEELIKLGFTLDSVKIEEIYDSQGYLEAVGKQRNAIVKRDARIKEAEAEAEAQIVESMSKQKAADAEFKAKAEIERYETSFRELRASLHEQMNAKEARAEYARQIESLLQQKKVEEIREAVHSLKYNADLVVPAMAERKADELKAIGKASYLKEQGLAMANAVKEMRSEWQDGASKELFMLHILPNIVDNVSRTIAENLKIEKLVVLGNGGIPNHVSDVTSTVITFLEQIRNATGVDLTRIISEQKSLPVKKELD